MHIARNFSGSGCGELAGSRTRSHTPGLPSVTAKPNASANQAGDEVDRTPYDHYAKHVRQESVGEHGAPDTSIADGGIGHLVAHTDRECDVGKVAVGGSAGSVRVSEGDAHVP